MIAISKKVEMPRTEKVPVRRRRMSFWRGLLVLVVSIIVAALIVVSVWATIGAMTQKTKVSNEITQVIDLVDVTRRYANVERGFGQSGREDVVAKMASTGQVQVSNNESGGLKTLANPWGGTLVAYTVPPGFFRIETVVPSRACVRIINLLTPNIQSLGIKQVDAKGVDESWRQIYLDKGANVPFKLANEQIAAGCRSDQFVILDFTFTLR